MVTYNYNYYGVPTGLKFTNQNGDDIGDFVPLNVWGYYYDNAVNWGRPLDTSVYLWHLNPSCSYATNAAYNIKTGNTLNIDVAYNQSSTRVPLAMAASDVSGVDADYYKGFYTDPVYRLAYNDSHAQGYAHTALFYNIVYNGFCAVPRLAVYRADGSDGFIGATLDTLASAINTSPSTRFLSYFRYDLYSGTYNNRAISEYYNESTYRTVAMPDILSDRPIPHTCTLVRDAVSDSSASPPHEPAWTDDKVYSPFAAALCRDWSLSNTESTDNQYRVGFTQQYTPANLRNGRGSYNGGNITGQFFKFNPTIQDFDDVKYKWEVVIYDMSDKIFLQAGYNISSLSHNLRFMTKLTILDRKGAATEGEAVVRAVKHEIAYLGFYFADNVALGATGVLGSTGNGNGIYLPIFDDTKTTTGNYVTGDDIKKIPYADATDISAFEYNPEESGSDTGDLETVINRGNVSGGLWYTLEQNQLSNLTTWLNTTYRPTEQELTEDFKGVNPADYIISLKYYPFQIQDSTAVNDVTLGGLDTGIDAPYLSRLYGQGAGYYDLGSFTFVPPYIAGNWTDSYNKILLYVPWCGFAELDAATFCQSPDTSYNTLHVTMQIDFATGCCNAYIYRNMTMIDSLSGTVGVDIPLSAVSQGSYQNAIKQAEIAVKQAKLNQWASRAGFVGAIGTAAAGVASGNPVLAAAGAIGIVNASKSAASAVYGKESAEYTLEHTAPHIGNIESAAPFNGCISDQTAKVYIFRPATLAGADLTTYGNTVGFACCKSGKLSDFHGLTVCSNVKLDAIDAPAHHKAAIQQALIKGVYLP